MTSRRDFLKLLGSAALLPAVQARAQAQPAQKFVFASNAPYDSLDPHTVFDASRAGVRFNLYDGLYRYVDNPPKLTPWLAESYTVSADRKSYEFKLRPDAVFHDGTPLAAQDVVYSINRILALNKGPAALYQGVIKPGSTVAPDAHTVVFNLASPSAIFLATVPDIAVLNSALMKQREVNGDWAEGWLGRNEAGSGSYELSRFDPAVGWSARRFKAHFAGFGTSPIEEIEFRNVLETNTRVLGLMRGDFQGSDGFMPYDQIERLRQSPNVQIIEQESMRVFLFALNNARPPLDDVHFRRAMAYAFDYAGYIETIMKGSVSRNPGPLPITMWGSPHDLKGYTFDLKKASEELKLVKSPLRTLTINALAGHSESEQAAILFQSSLRQIGIETKIEVSPWPVVANRLLSLDTRPDIIPIWKSTFYLDPNNWVGEGFGTRYHGQRSLSYYSNAEFDERLERALVSDNQEEREHLYEEMTRMVSDDAAGIFIYNTRWYGPYSKKVSGIRFSPVNNGQDFRWATIDA
ncbi:ABC transporter substrate-binding protein [Rhizobium leguminosarum]|uniref:ABC transporter substrate-binding protein n=1 Tax=Rhizobium leguminosarum TaxID=384 RepID=UPI001C948FB9|nr:ABC transporter substrate-binding protein [Rhizobium leguminosarum]MBY5537724.1 ABC transporter substrate-binding protein [Rhizobium leguminosarum]